MIKERNLAALAIIAVLAACGGGGGGGSVPSSSGGGTVAPTATPTSGALPAGYLIDKVTMTFKSGTYATSSATSRRVQTVGSGTASITFTLQQVNGVPTSGAPQTFNLTPANTADCTVNGNQALVCTLPLAAPIGQNDVFFATTYDANGNVTGSGAVALTVAQNATNTASIVLSAQVNSVAVLAGNSYIGNYNSYAKARHTPQSGRRIVQGPPPFLQSIPVYVIAFDTAGNTILNPAAYSSPVYVQQGFDPYDYGNAYTADITLTVLYGSQDALPCTASGTATTSGWWGSLTLCSPSDVVSASLSANGGTNPSDYVALFGWTSPSQLVPTPGPSQTPLPYPTVLNQYSETYFEVGYPASPTPSPSPTGPTGTLPVTGQ